MEERDADMLCRETEAFLNPDRAGEERLLDAFLRGHVDNRSFHHADHVRVAFALLQRHDWPDAVNAFRTGVKTIAAKAGKEGAYNETVTIAFLSLIAERLFAAAHSGFRSFADANGDLLDKSILMRWYTKERLNSAMSKRIFLLPDSRANDL